MKSIIALLLFTSLAFSQSNVVSTKYKYYERVFVLPATTKVDPTIYKPYELKEFPNDTEAIKGGLQVGDFYSLPPVSGKSFIVKIMKLPVLPTTNGSVVNNTIYMSKEIIEN